VKAFNGIQVVLDLVFVALVGVWPQSGAAQETVPSRADVKAQTKASNKAGELLRAGEAPLPEQPSRSWRTRTQRKGETLDARQRDELLPAGEATFKAHTAQPPRSDRTRADRKAEAIRAAREGALMPAGEAAVPSSTGVSR
jgi:hypothetical protein